MLALFRQHFHNPKIPLSLSFFKDLNWFNTFLINYNGITYYDDCPVDESIFLDAFLTGLGGVFQHFVYAIPIPRGYKAYHINHLEMINVMVALKLWGQAWANKNIKINCDNQAVVEVLTTGRARDEVLATCARNILLLTAMYNLQIIVSHIAGTKNTVADLLSRWKNSVDNYHKLNLSIPDHVWLYPHIDLLLFNDSI